MSNTIKNVLQSLLGSRTNKWELCSGYTAGESFMIFRIERIKKGQLRRLHAQIEELIEKEHGSGERKQ